MAQQKQVSINDQWTAVTPKMTDRKKMSGGERFFRKAIIHKPVVLSLIHGEEGGRGGGGRGGKGGMLKTC